VVIGPGVHQVGLEILLQHGLAKRIPTQCAQLGDQYRRIAQKESEANAKHEAEWKASTNQARQRLTSAIGAYLTQTVSRQFP
jgi:hypothetical protein